MLAAQTCSSESIYTRIVDIDYYGVEVEQRG